MDLRTWIENLGGAPAVSALFGRAPYTAYKWISRGHLPISHYVDMHLTAKRHGVQIPDNLWRPPKDKRAANGAAKDAGA